MADQLCFSNKSVEDAFLQDGVRGTNDMRALPNIGPYIQSKLTSANMTTINQALLRLSQFQTPTSLMRFLTQLLGNARPNECVVRANARKYHAADVNICAYNTIIKLIQFANAQQATFGNFGFSQAFPCTFASRLVLRTRGSNPGSRHCVCHATSQQCQQFPNECRWQNRKQVCLPRGGGNEQAGYFGKIMANNHRLAQRKPGKNGRYMNRTYVEGWATPNRPRQAQAEALVQQGRGRRPGRGRGQGPRRSTRRRRANTWFSSQQYVLSGGHLSKAIHEWEDQTEQRSKELRRFYNFVKLTN